MRRILLGFAAMGLVCVFCPQIAMAQDNTKMAINAPKPAFELTAHNINQDRQKDIPNSLKINNLDIKIDINGSLVQTALTIDFGNPTAQTLEGDFKISLPAGAYVINYALDVNGIMTDGVLQPKLKAREAYEENLRRGVDPGIGEINDANQFTTKVFPIFPNQGRKVRIVYVTPIGADGKYELPMTSSGIVGKTSLVINGDDIGSANVTAPSGLSLQRPNANSYAINADETALSGKLSISGLLKPDKISLSRHKNGEEFFDLIIRGEESVTQKPKSVRIFWDSSRSRREDDINKERELVSKYIEAVRPQSVELVSFSDNVPVISRLTSPNPGEISRAISAIDYSGATRLEDLEQTIGTRADICLFVGDGNISIDNFAIQKYPCRLISISSSKNARGDILNNIATQNAGSFIDLKTISIDAAMAQLQSSGSGLREIRANNVAIPYISKPIGENLYRIIGPKPRAQNLVFELNNSVKTLNIPNQPSFDNNGAGTIWGANSLELLSATDAPDEDKLLALVRKYNIATRDYSFVVLETGRDYANNKIAPPSNAPAAIMREYKETRDRLARVEDEAKATRFGEIIEQWNGQIDWWKKPHLTLAEIRKRGAIRGREAEAANASRPAPPPQAMMEAPAPPPPAPPPNPTGRREMAADAVGNATMSDADTAAEAVVVTGTRRRNETDAAAPLQRQSNIRIETAAWNPERPYLRALSSVGKGEKSQFEDAFTAQEREFGNTPAFYFDMAEWAFRNGFESLAAKIARNALELSNTNIETKIMLAQRLLRYGDFENAVWLNEQVLRQTPNKPQALRNLALSLIEKADADLKLNRNEKSRAIAEYFRALEHLNKIILSPNDGDYDGIEIIALMEANHTINKLRALGVTQRKLNEALNPRLTALLDVDIRVVLEWNTDKTDMDLWVDEPSGERAIYSNPATQLGGRLSNDMTQGYGPEEYLLRRAPNGTYKVLSNVYAADRLDPNGPTNVRVTLYRDWGRPSEKRETFVVEATKPESGNGIEIGRFIKR